MLVFLTGFPLSDDRGCRLLSLSFFPLCRSLSLAPLFSDPPLRLGTMPNTPHVVIAFLIRLSG